MDHLDSTGIIGETELAQWADLSVAVLRKWRREGRGPRYLKLGRLVRYRVRDVDLWLNAHAVERGRKA